jgi:hypothetical protein
VTGVRLNIRPTWLHPNPPLLTVEFKRKITTKKEIKKLGGTGN